jgi:hypothetical protein
MRLPPTDQIVLHLRVTAEQWVLDGLVGGAGGRQPRAGWQLLLNRERGLVGDRANEVSFQECRGASVATKTSSAMPV